MAPIDMVARVRHYQTKSSILSNQARSLHDSSRLYINRLGLASHRLLVAPSRKPFL